MADQLTELEQLLLLAVLRLGEGAYGASLQDELAQEANRAVSLGTIYVTLGRMEERGLAESVLAPPTSERGGRSKRIYEVTPDGREMLDRSRHVLEHMWSGVPANPE